MQLLNSAFVSLADAVLEEIGERAELCAGACMRAYLSVYACMQTGVSLKRYVLECTLHESHASFHATHAVATHP